VHRLSLFSPFFLPPILVKPDPELLHSDILSIALLIPLHILHCHQSTLQIASSLSSTHYLSPGRMDDPLMGSPVAQETQLYMRPLYAVCARRSATNTNRLAPARSGWKCPAKGGRPVGNLTCWFMSRMAMSLRSCVKRSKASSMAASSVFWSTTRKFFWASGGAVTCCSGEDGSVEGGGSKGCRAPYTNTGEKKACHGVLVGDK